jgi:hypothetical protein
VSIIVEKVFLSRKNSFVPPKPLTKGGGINSSSVTFYVKGSFEEKMEMVAHEDITGKLNGIGR